MSCFAFFGGKKNNTKEISKEKKVRNATGANEPAKGPQSEKQNDRPQLNTKDLARSHSMASETLEYALRVDQSAIDSGRNLLTPRSGDNLSGSSVKRGSSKSDKRRIAGSENSESFSDSRYSKKTKSTSSSSSSVDGQSQSESIEPSTPRKDDLKATSTSASSSSSSSESDAEAVSPVKPHPTIKAKSDVGSHSHIVPIVSPKVTPVKRRVLRAHSAALSQEIKALKRNEKDIAAKELTIDDLDIDLAKDVDQLQWFGDATGVDMEDTYEPPITPSRVRMMLEPTLAEREKHVSLSFGDVDLDELSKALDNFADSEGNELPADDS